MNAKSKIFLALALVLSVTACSKGGGSHSKLNGTETHGSTTPEPGSDRPSYDNSYIAYQPGPKVDDRVSRHVGKNVWFAASGDYAVHGADFSPPGQNPWAHNLAPSASQYKFIQFGQDGKFASIVTDANKPDDRLFKNNSGTAMIGHKDGNIFLASPWEQVHGNVFKNGSENKYHGTVVFRESKDIIHDNLTMDLTVNYIKDPNNVNIAMHSNYSAVISDNNGKQLAQLENATTQINNPIIMADDSAHFTTNNSAEAGYLSGMKMVWGYTDKNATSVSGIIGAKDNTDAYGAFIADKTSN
ncbi:hypothetical protein ACP179_07600 [Xenorhabdus stockiae]|uniref:hypothetical protein n=1 Tax=Xenorhabdus stockiae TaxID=351614 RepID=UPI003CE8587E